ncbi:MAG: tRNA (N6-threonylcarbamoyladenosine(37)-N6)-methyltransferase TrmO [bacterium]
MPSRIEQPTIVPAAGNLPKRIEEFVGRLNTGTRAVSIARMVSPAGWEEPAQAPDFDEYTLVLRGTLRVTSGATSLDVRAGQAVVAHAGEPVRYSTPEPGGAEYVAVCLPAFSPEAVRREPGASPPSAPASPPRPGASSLASPRLAFRPIGRVRSPVKEPVDASWGRVQSTVELEPAFHGAARGLETFSHALVVTHLHLDDAEAGALVRRPRGRADLPQVGVLAQRSRHRPNPIGITAVEIVAVTDATIAVRGLDAVDGTPVLDVKPYFPAFDRVDAAKAPPWVDELMRDYF